MALQFHPFFKGIQYKQESAVITYDATLEGAVYNNQNLELRVQINGADRRLLTDTEDQTISGDITISGLLTLSQGLEITPTTNQLILGTTNTLTISSLANAADRTATIPILAGNDVFAFLAASQTLTNKTLTSPIITGATISGSTISLDDTDSIYALSLVSTSTLTTNRNLILDVNDGARTITLSGNLTLGNTLTTGAAVTINNTFSSTGAVSIANGMTLAEAFTTAGANSLTLTTSASTNVTLPTTGTLATLAGSEILTNKDIDGGTASNTHRITIPKAAKTVLDALTRKEATIMYASDESALYVDNGSSLVAIGGNYTTYTTESISAGGTISISASVGFQSRRVQGNSVPVIASNTPFGTSTTPKDGTTITLIGQSDTNTVTITNADIAYGCCVNGNCTLGKYDSLTLQYDSIVNRYIEIARNV